MKIQLRNNKLLRKIKLSMKNLFRRDLRKNNIIKKKNKKYIINKLRYTRKIIMKNSIKITINKKKNNGLNVVHT